MISKRVIHQSKNSIISEKSKIYGEEKEPYAASEEKREYFSQQIKNDSKPPFSFIQKPESLLHKLNTLSYSDSFVDEVNEFLINKKIPPAQKEAFNKALIKNLHFIEYLKNCFYKETNSSIFFSKSSSYERINAEKLLHKISNIIISTKENIDIFFRELNIFIEKNELSTEEEGERINIFNTILEILLKLPDISMYTYILKNNMGNKIEFIETVNHIQNRVSSQQRKYLVVKFKKNNNLNFIKVFYGDNFLCNYIKYKERNTDIFKLKIIQNTLIHKDFENRINDQDEIGNTALHYAMKNNDYLIAYFLIYKKAEILKNHEKKTPLQMMEHSNHRNINNLEKYILLLDKLNYSLKDIYPTDQATGLLTQLRDPKVISIIVKSGLSIIEDLMKSIGLSSEEFLKKYLSLKSAIISEEEVFSIVEILFQQKNFDIIETLFKNILNYNLFDLTNKSGQTLYDTCLKYFFDEEEKQKFENITFNYHVNKSYYEKKYFDQIKNTPLINSINEIGNSFLQFALLSELDVSFILKLIDESIIDLNNKNLNNQTFIDIALNLKTDTQEQTKYKNSIIESLQGKIQDFENKYSEKEDLKRLSSFKCKEIIDTKDFPVTLISREDYKKAKKNNVLKLDKVYLIHKKGNLYKRNGILISKDGSPYVCRHLSSYCFSFGENTKRSKTREDIGKTYELAKEKHNKYMKIVSILPEEIEEENRNFLKNIYDNTEGSDIDNKIFETTEAIPFVLTKPGEEVSEFSLSSQLKKIIEVLISQLSNKKINSDKEVTAEKSIKVKESLQILVPSHAMLLDLTVEEYQNKPYIKFRFYDPNYGFIFEDARMEDVVYHMTLDNLTDKNLFQILDTIASYNSNYDIFGKIGGCIIARHCKATKPIQLDVEKILLNKNFNFTDARQLKYFLETFTHFGNADKFLQLMKYINKKDTPISIDLAAKINKSALYILAQRMPNFSLEQFKKYLNYLRDIYPLKVNDHGKAYNHTNYLLFSLIRMFRFRDSENWTSEKIDLLMKTEDLNKSWEAINHIIEFVLTKALLDNNEKMVSIILNNLLDHGAMHHSNQYDEILKQTVMESALLGNTQAVKEFHRIMSQSKKDNKKFMKFLKILSDLFFEEK